MERLVVIQLGGRAMRSAVDMLDTSKSNNYGQGDDSAFV